MKLKGKFKKDFKEWLKTPRMENPSTAQTMDRGYFSDIFKVLPESAQVGVVISFCYDKGIDFDIKEAQKKVIIKAQKIYNENNVSKTAQ